MVSANQIREVILNYIQSDDADEFILEFSKLSFGISQHGDPDAIALARAVESQIALVHAGHMAVGGLRRWMLQNAFKQPSTSSTTGNISKQEIPGAVPALGGAVSKFNLSMVA
jgi:predicted MPP superfamily phosphohydrolase